MAPQLIEKDGVTVYIYGKEHVPPHIHAFSGDDEALIDIRTGEIFGGYIANKKLSVVKDWLNEGKNRELTEQNFYELNPRLKPEEPTVKKASMKKKTKKKGNK